MVHEVVCRSRAYSGDSTLVEDLLFRPEHPLIDQSLPSRLGATITNGDGFGIVRPGGDELRDFGRRRPGHRVHTSPR